MIEYLQTAEQIAREAHAGQLYGDRDYIEAHVAPIAGMIAMLGYDESYQAVGWLHDVFEDSEIQPQEAIDRGVPLYVVTAAKLLTKIKGVEHGKYLDDIITDPRARVAKFCDSSHNFANTVIYVDGQTPEQYQGRVLEYAHNLAVLGPLLPIIGNESVS